MNNTICIDTATSICSVSLTNEQGLICTKESNEERSHASKLTVLINECVHELNTDFTHIKTICVNKGPGSYTGLRIGVSAAKAISYTNNAKLYSVDSLIVLCSSLKASHPELFTEDIIFYPMIDARRMEVYTCAYDFQLQPISGITATILEKSSFKKLIKTAKKAVFFGDGASKYKSIVNDSRAIFIENVFSSSAYMLPLLEQKINSVEFEDLAYFEPLYLKDFAEKKA